VRFVILGKLGIMCETFFYCLDNKVLYVCMCEIFIFLLQLRRISVRQ